MIRELVIASLFCLTWIHAQEPLGNVRTIRDLDAQRREQLLPVRLDSVVTYYHPGWGVLFIHDDTDGICVGVSEDKRPSPPYQPGMRLKIKGHAGPGEFLPVVLPDTMVMLLR